jgi:V8-like Glu-specific endopeptidase
MSNGALPPTSDDPDTPISNQREETVLVEVPEPVVRPPSEGAGSAPAGAAADGTEQVQGHVRTEAPIDELWSAPATTQLRDIGEASFGLPPPVAETVHGPDDRVQITNTAVYPWRVHASLLITAADNSLWIGTGWFIGPHTLMTAGHVVYIKNSGVPGRDGWVRRITVMPGRNGSSLPYGSVRSSNFRTVNGWANSGDENFDYGAIIIPTELGNAVGWFGFGVWSDADLQGVTANISGYPGDKPAGTHWYDFHTIASVSARKVFYDIDTAGGQSGSAAYRMVNGGRYGIAIHAYDGDTSNSGIRITQPVYDNLLAWNA